MNIMIPKFAQECDDIGQMLWIAFMARVASDVKRKDGFVGQRYFFQAPDVRYFFRKFISKTTYLTQGVEAYIRVGKGSDQVWFLEWLQGEPEMVNYNCKSAEHCAVWGYMLGKWYGTKEPIMKESHDAWPEQQARVITRRDDREFFRYFGEKTWQHKKHK